MKTTSLLSLLAVAALLLLPAPTHAQNVIWDYTALGAAPATDDKLFLYDTSATASKTMTIANLFTGPAIAAYTLTGTGTIGNGCTLTTPVLSGSITGTYTLAGTPTITAPTINAYTIAGTGTIGNGCTITTPVLSGSITGTYTLAGTPTITAPTINAYTIAGTGTIGAGCTLTAPTIAAYTMTGTGTIGNGCTLTTPAIAGAAITGTVTIGNGCTLTTPTIAGATITGTVTIGAGCTITSPTLVTPTLGVASGTSVAVSGLLTTSSPSAAFGYATGAGGTVTQATDRTTGVTLSKTTGQITTNNGSLAAGAEAEFTVTNTVVEATDTVILNITPGGTGTPFAYVSTVAAGSFKIIVTNLHASTADTSADVINFTVIKGKSS